MKNRIRILGIIILCLQTVSFGYAQNSATEGTEFYLNFMSNNGQAATNASLSLQIRYVVSKTCYITTQYGDGTYLDNNVQYTPGIYSRVVDKNKCYTQPIAAGLVSNNQYIKITATENIGVYGLNMYQATTDATTILPVEALGTDYTILSNDGTSESLSIMAPLPGTTITIKDAAGTALVSNQSLSTGTVSIYSVTNTADFTGYTVESNNKIAVFISKQCGMPHPGGGCDHNWEQMWPGNTAGRHYLVWSMSRNPSISVNNGQSTDYIKIIGLEDATTVTKKIGTTSTTVTLNKHQIDAFNTPSGVTVSPYENNSAGIIELTSDKPFLVDHILGDAPCIKWISSIEQRVTKAVISPFIPIGTSQITYHILHIIIPADSENNMQVKEVRAGVETNVALTFYTNITNPDYKIAHKEYAIADDVMIYLDNPGGFIAYITGHGSAESYIITAGAGAFDLSAYFTVDGTLYQVIDGTTVCGAGIRTFDATLWGANTGTPGYLKWYVNGVEETAARDQSTWGKNLTDGVYTIRMDVLDMDNVFHQYTTTFTVSVTAVTTHPSTFTASMCYNSGNFPSALSITATGTNTSYQWYRNTIASNKSGGTIISGATSISYTPTSALTAGDYYYYCIVTGDCGLDTSNVSGKHTITATVSASLSISASANNICSGTSITYTAVPVNGGSSPGYQWKKNGVDINGATASTYSYSPVNGDVITCELTSSVDCTTNPVMSNSVTMIVIPSVVPSVRISASNNTICSGTSVTYTATSTNGGTSPTYQWRRNGVNISGATGSICVYAPAMGDTLTCVMTSSTTCASPNPVASNGLVITVTPSVMPAVVISASANNVCSGTSITYTAVPTNGGTSPGYQWKKNGVPISGATATTYTYTPGNGDIITCELTSDITCTDSNPVISNGLTMTITQMVTPSVTISATPN